MILINDGGDKYPNNRGDPILGSVWPHGGPANYKFAVIFSFSSYTPRIMAGPNVYLGGALLMTTRRCKWVAKMVDICPGVNRPIGDVEYST